MIKLNIRSFFAAFIAKFRKAYITSLSCIKATQKRFFTLSFAIAIISFFAIVAIAYIVANIAAFHGSKHLYTITVYNNFDRTGTTYYTDSYIDTNGSVTFVDAFNIKHKIRGNYEISGN